MFSNTTVTGTYGELVLVDGKWTYTLDQSQVQQLDEGDQVQDTITLTATDLPYDRVSPNPDISATRMATLAALAAGVPGPFILLTTVSAAMQKVPARAVLEGASFTARVGQRIDERALRDFLVRMGFSQTSTVSEPGDYALRGGIIDIYPPGEGGPVRLDLFGDVLDDARGFDPVTQRTTEKLPGIEF